MPTEPVPPPQSASGAPPAPPAPTGPTWAPRRIPVALLLVAPAVGLLALAAQAGQPPAARAVFAVFGASGLVAAVFYLLRLAGAAAEDLLLRAWLPLRALVRLLLFPYAAASWVVLWLARAASPEPAFDRIADGLYLGALPFPWQRAGLRAAGITAILNLCFEFPPVVGGSHYRPMLDGVAPRPEHLAEAVAWIVERRGRGERVLVHCAQGHGRSACVMVAALLALGLADTPEAAVALVAAARPGIRLREEHRRALLEWRRGGGA